MPFFTKKMLDYIDDENEPKPKTKDANVINHQYYESKNYSDSEINTNKNIASQYRKKLLEKRCECILRTPGPITAEKSTKFHLYQFKQTKSNQILLRSEFGEKIFGVTHCLYPKIPMIVRVYEPEQANRIQNPLYFRILRYLGKKHPLIVQTWDIFINSNLQIIVFQQNTHSINMTQFILSKHPNGEQESVVCHWSRQICRALEYLINSAVCHHNLTSNCVLINLRDKMSIQITDFYRAFIYKPYSKDNLRYKQSLRYRETIRPDFKPPEVYGDEHQNGKYDPTSADMWSLGAIIYFALSGQYPHNYKINSRNIETEIFYNLKSIETKISKQSYNLLLSLLTTKVNKRLKLEQMLQHSWFGLFEQNNDQSIMMYANEISNDNDDIDDDEKSVTLSNQFDLNEWIEKQPRKQPLNKENKKNYLFKQFNANYDNHN